VGERKADGIRFTAYDTDDVFGSRIFVVLWLKVLQYLASVPFLSLGATGDSDGVDSSVSGRNQPVSF
jgi:hypothetical protein